MASVDGNGRMGRYWQTILLARWKGIFAWIPVETIVKSNQQEYYQAIAKSYTSGDSSPFIHFMLNCLLTVIKEYEVTNKVTNNCLSKTERKVLNLINEDAHITRKKLCEMTGLSDSGIKKVLGSLRQKDIIERVGANKNGYWVIKKYWCPLKVENIALEESQHFKRRLTRQKRGNRRD